MDSILSCRSVFTICATKPGDMFEELLIGNYDLVKQAEINNHFLLEQSRQMTLFDYQYDY